MNTAFKLDITQLVIAAGVGVALFVLLRKAGRVAAQSFNPASDQNLAYRGTNAALRALGFFSEEDTLGTALYDWVRAPPRQAGPLNPITGLRLIARADLSPVNPASDNNVIYRGVNRLLRGGGIIQDDETLGTALYRWVNGDN